MKYDQIIQVSPLYEYGEGKEFATREEALEKTKKAEKDAKTEMALNKLIKFSTTKIIEENNAFKVEVNYKIPYVFELNKRNGK